MRIKKIAVAISGLCIAVAVGMLSYTHLTTAYYVSEDTKENIAVMGNMGTNIREDLYDLEKKNISVTNTGNVDCYVRVMVKIPKIKDSAGEIYTAAVRDCNGKIIDLDTASSITSGSGVWQRDSTDGYWYYSKPVAAGSTIQFLNSIKYGDLNEGVTVNKEQLDVVIYVESAQADNREIEKPKDAFEFTKK